MGRRLQPRSAPAQNRRTPSHWRRSAASGSSNVEQRIRHVSGRLLVDRRGTRRADNLVLRAGAARATDSTNDPAILNQRNAPARGNDVIERHDVLDVRFLNSIFKNAGRSSEFDSRASLVFRNANGANLRTVHADEGDQVGTGIDDSDIKLPTAFAGFCNSGLDRSLG